VTVEKLKWDGSVSARSVAWLLDDHDGRRCWLVPAGLPRERPRLGRVDRPKADTIFLAAGAWWIVSAQLDEDGRISWYTVDAALSPASPVEGWLRWVDLDLDLRLGDGSIELLDEEDFTRRARQMGYPPEVCDGAWSGIHDATRRQAAEAWPFDGWLVERLAEGVRTALGRDVLPRPPEPARQPVALSGPGAPIISR
jgi:hypothetical protein